VLQVRVLPEEPFVSCPAGHSPGAQPTAAKPPARTRRPGDPRRLRCGTQFPQILAGAGTRLFGDLTAALGTHDRLGGGRRLSGTPGSEYSPGRRGAQSGPAIERLEDGAAAGAAVTGADAGKEGAQRIYGACCVVHTAHNFLMTAMTFPAIRGSLV
jgi:hypothetical protein